MNFITFDIDWAPDFAILKCMEICEKYGVSAIFFVTHETKVIDIMKKNSLFELGIHPNFSSNSTQGSSTEKVLDFFKILLPNASCIRTHSLKQSTPLLEKIVKYNPKIKFDFSILMYLSHTLNTSHLFFDDKKKIKRFPFFFEDDISFNDPSWNWNIDFSNDGLRIFNFHPALIYLNSKDYGSYKKIKNSNLQNTSINDFKKNINFQYGCANYLEDLLRNNDFIKYNDLINL